MDIGYSAVLNFSTAIIPKATANPPSASMLGTAAGKSAPKTINLLKPEVAQPCGVKLARNCIHFGVMNSGHQQPPSGAKDERSQHTYRACGTLGLDQCGKHYGESCGHDNHEER